jgi:histone deacetylase 1/2
MEEVRQRYRPDAVVIQCGADSLAYDRLGTYNTTLRGHGNCVKFVKSWGLPLLVLGGGGYTIKNVARCWANETAICLGVELEDSIPMNDFYEFYGNDFKLHFKAKDEPNLNTKEYIDFLLTKCLANLKALEGAPSVGI